MNIPDDTVSDIRPPRLSLSPSQNPDSDFDSSLLLAMTIFLVVAAPTHLCPNPFPTVYGVSDMHFEVITFVNGVDAAVKNLKDL